MNMCDIATCDGYNKEEASTNTQIQNVNVAPINNNNNNGQQAQPQQQMPMGPQQGTPNFNPNEVQQQYNQQEQNPAPNQPYFNALSGFLPDGTPKHVDLGNGKLMSRINHVNTDGANFADIDRVFDSEVPQIPQNQAIRFNPQGNELLIPRNMVQNFRFKQLDENGKIKMLKHLESVTLKLKNSKEMTLDVAKEILEADQDIFNALMKDEKVVKELDDMKIDYRKIRNNTYKTDDFDLEEKKVKHLKNIPSDVKQMEVGVSDENDELTELVNDFGI